MYSAEWYTVQHISFVQDGRLPVHYAATNPDAQPLYQALLAAAGQFYLSEFRKNLQWWTI